MGRLWVRARLCGSREGVEGCGVGRLWLGAMVAGEFNSRVMVDGVCEELRLGRRKNGGAGLLVIRGLQCNLELL